MVHHSHSHLFTDGSTVEISPDDEGFKGAWYLCKILNSSPNNPSPSSVKSKRKRASKVSNLVEVQYESLVSVDNENEPLRKLVDVSLLRPVPPHTVESFALNDVVDAFYRDGWWTGVVTKVLEGSRYSVYFQSPDFIEFSISDLRPHLNWVNGEWVRPPRQFLVSSMNLVSTKSEARKWKCGKSRWQMVIKPWPRVELNNNDAFDVSAIDIEKLIHFLFEAVNSGVAKEFYLFPGNDVEVKLDNENPCDVWYLGSIVKEIRNNYYLVAYRSLGTDAAAKKEVQIRSHPEEESNHELNCVENTWATPQNESLGVIMDNLIVEAPSSTSSRKIIVERLIPGEKISKISSEIPAGLGKKKMSNATPDSNSSLSQPLKKQKKGNAKAASVTSCRLRKRSSENTVEEVTSDFTTPLKQKAKELMSTDQLSAKTENASGERVMMSHLSTLSSANVHAIFAYDMLVMSESLFLPVQEGKEQKVGGMDTQVKETPRKRGRPPREVVEKGSATNPSELTPSTRLDSPGMRCAPSFPCEDSSKLVKDQKLTNGPAQTRTLMTSRVRPPRTKKERMRKETLEQIFGKHLQKTSLKREKSDGPSKNIKPETQAYCDTNTENQDASKEKIPEAERDLTVKEAQVDADRKSITASVDDCPSSMWISGSDAQLPSKDTGHEEISRHLDLVDVGREGVIDDFQGLPFLKGSPIWTTIESMPIFRKMPQRPHFRPLQNFKEEHREGLAIGNMVTFATLVEKTAKLQFDDPKSVFDSSLEALLDLETHGFDVRVVRGRINEMLAFKDKQGQLLDKSKDFQSQIMELNHQKKRIDDEIDEIDKKLRELQEHRALAVSKKESKDLDIAHLQTNVDVVGKGIQNARVEFQNLAAAPWLMVWIRAKHPVDFHASPHGSLAMAKLRYVVSASAGQGALLVH
ncbi:Agenet-like domain [Dillenia turbinata]|uniref:Agenet-like domain n=1 Tax=Dillenia turbinata TaxID=194707 RepID=A0AAN8VNA0_9MAGN